MIILQTLGLYAINYWIYFPGLLKISNETTSLSTKSWDLLEDSNNTQNNGTSSGNLLNLHN